MDKQTQNEMNRISAEMPRDILRGVMKSEEKDSGREAILEQHIESLRRDPIQKHVRNKLSDEAQKLRDDLYSGKYQDKTRYVNDPKAAAKANEYMEFRIREAVRSGRIKEPKNDAFIQKMKERMRG